MSDVKIAHRDAEIAKCFPVLHELRPHLDFERLLAQVKRQAERAEYRLAYVEDGSGAVAAVAGYRIVEMLAWGKTLYVDDLVTTETLRGQGHASRLFDWLLAEAGRNDCDQFHLDSGVHRFGAHRFYLHKGMDITSHHFALKLKT